MSPADAAAERDLGTLPLKLIGDRFAGKRSEHPEAILVVHEAKDGPVYMTVGSNPPEIFTGGRDVWAVFAPPESQDPVASFMEEAHALEWAASVYEVDSWKIGRIDSTDRPVVKSSVAVLVYNKEGKILLGRLSKHGSWGMPESGVQIGESIESCAKRAVAVAAGLDVGAVSICQRAPYVNCFIEQAGQHFVVLNMVAEYLGGEPKVVSPIWDKWEWCDADLPPNPLYLTVQAVIDQVKKSLATEALLAKKASKGCVTSSPEPQRPRRRASARRPKKRPS